MYKTNILDINKENNKLINFKNYKFDINIIWIIIGLSSIVGTVLVAFIVSKIFSPLFQLKYMYPVVIVAWLLFAVIFSKFKYKKVYIILTIFIVLFGTIPHYIQIYNNDKEENKVFHETIEKTIEIGNNHDIIITDIPDFYWNTCKYYYPKTKCEFYTKKPIELNKDNELWLIIKEKINDSYISQFSDNYEYTTIIENGNVGCVNVNIYKLDRKK